MPKTEERIDKWLWEMRVFKTRTMATDACKKNRISMGGLPVKPSRMIHVGDKIEVRKPPVTYTFEVLDLPSGRLGAKLVPMHLRDLTPPEQYHLLEMARISTFVDRRKGLGRPTKRDARQMQQFRQESALGTPFFLDWEDQEDD